MLTLKKLKSDLNNKWTKVFVLLVFVYIANYYYWNWGLITVKVTDAPLSKVISSIEWQGWVKIYTNLPPDTKVTMYVDHVRLPEALETLATNVGGRPQGADRPRNDANPNGAPGGGPPGAGAQANSTDGTPRPPRNRDRSFGGAQANGGTGGQPGGGAGGPPGGGGGRGGGFGGGGFGGGGAQWNLAFFIAPTSAQVKAEIRAFESGEPDDDMKVYTYPTMMQMVAGDDDIPAADPTHQAWPGYKPPSAPPPTAPDASGNTPPAPPVPAADATPTVHTYLQSFAESANIWIMSPDSWAPAVASPPPPDDSIIHAVKNFVSQARGTLVQAYVLRAGRGGQRGGTDGGGRGGFGDMTTMTDRLRNAINGLPPEDRPDALASLNEEVKFFQDLQAKPPEQRRDLMMAHMMEKMLYSDRSRMSPAKRAQRYARMVAARQAAKGGK